MWYDVILSIRGKSVDQADTALATSNAQNEESEEERRVVRSLSS